MVLLIILSDWEVSNLVLLMLHNKLWARARSLGLLAATVSVSVSTVADTTEGTDEEGK